jgi:O-antigen ligase
MGASFSRAGSAMRGSQAVTAYRIARNFLPISITSALAFPPFGLALISPPSVYLASGLVFVFVILVVAEKALRTDWVIGRTNLFLPLALLTLLAGVSLSYAAHPVQGIRELLKMILAVGLFFSLVLVCSSRDHLRQLLRCIVWIGVALSLHGILVVLAVGLLALPAAGSIGVIDSDSMGFDFRIVTYDIVGLLGFASREEDFVTIGQYRFPRCASLFIEPGYFAGFLQLSLFATAAYAHLVGGSRHRLVSLGLLVQFAALVLSFSAGGWMAFLVGAVVTVIVRRRGGPAHGRSGRLRIAASLLVGAVVGIGFLRPDLVMEIIRQAVVDKFFSDEFLTSGAMRLISIQVGIESALLHPFLGVGVGQMPNIAPPGFGDDVRYGANNALLSTQIELGLIGLILYVWVLMSILSVIIQTSKAARFLPRPDANVAAYSCGAALALTFHAMIIETKWVPFLWIGVALLYVVHRLSKSTFPRTSPASLE